MSTELEEKATAVTVVERAALALGADEHEKELVALSKKYRDITEIKNPAGRHQCHAAAMELSNARIATTKTGETAREDANAFQKAVIAEVKRRIAIISAEETRLLALRDAWDAEREAEKIAKALAESQRITAIRQKIDAIRKKPAEMVGMPSDEIGEMADILSEAVLSLDFYAEYTGEAQAERDGAVKQLRTMQEAMRQHEEAQAALEVERATLARERAEAEERERVAAEERAAQARKDAAARAEQETKDRTERERAEAQQRAANATEQRKLDAQRRENEQHQAEQQAILDKLLMAEEEIKGIQQQVIIASMGRAGVRKGGTIECLRDTLTETEAWVIDERFGILAGAAASAKTTAVAEIRRLLAESEAREAAEAEERIKQEEAEAAARAEAERIQAEKDAAEAAEIAARRAAEEEAERRERVQFETVGPEADEILSVLAEHYAVNKVVACNWLYRHAWAQMEIAA